MTVNDIVSILTAVTALVAAILSGIAAVYAAKAKAHAATAEASTAQTTEAMTEVKTEAARAVTAAAKVAEVTGTKIDAMHSEMNGKLGELVKARETVARAEGMQLSELVKAKQDVAHAEGVREGMKEGVALVASTTTAEAGGAAIPSPPASPIILPGGPGSGT